VATNPAGQISEDAAAGVVVRGGRLGDGKGFEIGRADAYGRLPPPDGQGTYFFSPAYIDQAARDVAL
jgi:hypothetical protein